MIDPEELAYLAGALAPADAAVCACAGHPGAEACALAAELGAAQPWAVRCRRLAVAG